MLTIEVPASEPKNVTPMTEEEARSAINRINEGAKSIRIELLDLHRRQGWRTLGYATWKEFTEAEFPYNQSRLYQFLDAAEVEVNLVNAGIETSKILEVPESHIRLIKKAPITRQASAFQKLKEYEEEDGKVTEKEAEAAVAAVDPNFAYQKASSLVNKFIREGHDLTDNSVNEIFKDSSPRLKEVLQEPVWELLKEGMRDLPPPIKPSSANNLNTNISGEKEEEPEPATESERNECRKFILAFNTEDFREIVVSLPDKYKSAIREALG